MRFKVFECSKQTLSLYLFLIFHRSIPLFLGNICLVSSLATTYSSISGVPPIPLTKASTHSLTFRSRSSIDGGSDIILPSRNFRYKIKKRPRTNPVTSSPLARDRPLARRSSDGNHAMRVEDELFGSTLVEVHVALRVLLQCNYRSDGRVYHRLTDDLGDHVGQFAALCKVDGFAAEAAGLCEPLTIHIADDDHSCTE